MLSGVIPRLVEVGRNQNLVTNSLGHKEVTLNHQIEHAIPGFDVVSLQQQPHCMLVKTGGLWRTRNDNMIILWKTVCGEYSLKQFELKLKLASLVSRGIKHLRPYMCLRCWSFVSRLVPKGQDDYSLLKITLRQFLKLCIEFFLHALA